MAASHIRKTLFLLRHGQAQHNPRAEAAREAGCSQEVFMSLMKEDDALDAPLTDLGMKQAENAVSSLDVAERMRDLELVVSSPLTRAMRTAELALQSARMQLLDNCPTISPKWICLEEWREINGKLLNAKRKSRSEIAEQHPEWDVSQLKMEHDELWTPHEMESQEDCAERGYQGLLWLMDRPEEKVMIVGHGGIFRFLFQLHPQLKLFDERPEQKKCERFVKARFANCELREYRLVFKPHSDSADPTNLTEAQSFKRPFIELVEIY